MTKRPSLKRSIDATDQQGPVKRRKSQKLETYQKYTPGKKKYSSRVITWQEQRNLGGDFSRVGKGSWPALEILEESRDRAQGRTKRYLVAWRPHPQTGEEFEPDWKPSEHVSDDLIANWERVKREESVREAKQKEKAANRAARNRPVVPSSSDTPAENTEQQSDAGQSPPSLLSDSSASGLEISETQDIPTHSPRVNIPPLPLDKQEYETIGSSQFTLPATAALLDHQSPDAQFNIPSSQRIAAETVSPAPGASAETVRSQQAGETADPPFAAEFAVSVSPPPSAETAISDLPLLPAEAVVSASPESPSFHHPIDSSLDGTQTPQSRVSESSPRSSSARSKRRSKLSNIVSSVEEENHAEEASPSRSLQFITQIPISDIHVTIPKSPVQSSELEARSVRLSSPFGGETTSPDTSPVYIPSIRRDSIRRRAISGERLQKLSRTIPETQRPVSISPSRGSPEVLPNIPSQFTDIASTPSDQIRSSIMASPRIDVAPLESNETHLFNTPNSNNFQLSHDGNALTLTIHESIEDEPQSSNDISQVMTKSSSQESLSNEQEVETVDGIMIPVRPLLGPNEYAVPLPAEGKVKSQYDEIIKLQKRAILRFISRTGSPGTSDISSKKTNERNTMQDLLQQLNNTVTHTDLGLPMHTQYSLNSDANAAYAEYAGTKFELLGYLIDNLKDKDCSFAICAQAGTLQDLLEEYLRMKRVTIRRHDHAGTEASDNITQGLSIDLLTTQASKTVSLDRKPLFIIAFDVTFASADPQVRSLREAYGNDLPILHLLVTNSAEHVERCVPETLTSNIRLKVVVRTTYLASRNLGGDITYVPEESDQPADGRGMDMSEFQRAVRKSPARRLYLIADVIGSLAVSGELTTDWPLPDMPELKLNELDTPPKISRAGSRTPQLRITRQSTPASRAATPVGKKRLLDVEGDNESKRQRMTPVRDLLEHSHTPSHDSADARKRIADLSTELASTKHALLVAEVDQAKMKTKAEDWERSHDELLRRFEKERTATREVRKENKKLDSTILHYRERDETFRNEKAALRQQLTDIKAELVQARQDLTGAGGDVAQLENAREEVRTLNAKLQSSEKLVKSLREDFEFTREQYQAASKLAMDRTTEVKDLEEEVEKLKIAADDKKRSLKAMNYQTSLTMAMNKAEQFRLEAKSREAVIRKLQEENATLKSRRGVQTRGSSIQPASSPGPRSRQASPAATHLMPPSGSRASVLRHER